MKIGDMALVTTNGWFYAPDGRTYRAVFGKIKAIHSSEEQLGVKRGPRDVSWYMEIGDMVIAGCQILYAVNCTCVQTGSVHEKRPDKEQVTVRDGEIYVCPQ